MGSFTKNFRKRLLRNKLANTERMNQYLILHLQKMMAQAKGPTVEQLNQQRMDLIREVTAPPPPPNLCTAVEVYKGGR